MANEYDGNKAMNGNNLYTFWQTIKGLITGWLATKQNTITGGATTITSDNLDASKALVSNSSGKVAVSNVTSTELGYLSGATGNIQSQINDKQDTLGQGANIIIQDVYGSPEISVPTANTTGTDSASTSTLGAAGFALPDLTTDGTTTQDNNIDNYVTESIRGKDGIIHVRKASTAKYGVVKLGTNSTISTNIHPVGLNSSGQLAVSVAETDISGKQDKIKVGSATSGAVTTISAGTNIGIDISGTTATIKGTYSYALPVMTNSVRGGAKVYNNTAVTDTINSVTTIAGKYYGIQKNSSEQLVVNVPWSDTKMTDKSYTAGTDKNIVVGTSITDNNTLADVTKTLTEGANISITSTASAITIANTYSYTLPAATTTSLGGVIVGTDSNITVESSGAIKVNQATASALGVVKVADVVTGQATEGLNYVVKINGSSSGDNAGKLGIPTASTNAAGVMSTTQVSTLNSRAPLDSPALTGTPTAPTATASTDSTQIATTAFVHDVVDSAITGAEAFKGMLANETALKAYGDFKAGWYWRVSTAGSFVGEYCQVGDMIYCITTHSHTAGSALTNANFSVVQTNVDFLTDTEIANIINSVA